MTYVRDDRFGHLQFIDKIIEENIAVLKEKDREYGASWKQRGGVGAYMMLARKWDRLENALSPAPEPDQVSTLSRLGEKIGLPISPYDVITAAVVDTRDEGILDDIKDLMNYLILVMAEARYQQEIIIGEKDKIKLDGITLVEQK